MSERDGTLAVLVCLEDISADMGAAGVSLPLLSVELAWRDVAPGSLDAIRQIEAGIRQAASRELITVRDGRVTFTRAGRRVLRGEGAV